MVGIIHSWPRVAIKRDPRRGRQEQQSVGRLPKGAFRGTHEMRSNQRPLEKDFADEIEGNDRHRPRESEPTESNPQNGQAGD